jgi:orotidine-5'-phosphate decarboxylase
MELLQDRWDEGKFLCVGLDSAKAKLPKSVRTMPGQANRQVTFNLEIIKATRDLVCAYKPNIAFYEAEGPAGIRALEETILLANAAAPGVPVILDYKRGDIGNTNDGYVASAFDRLGADAVTVSPYLGQEALKPFLELENKGIIVLVRTSNPGAGEFQDLMVPVESYAKAKELHLDDAVSGYMNGCDRAPQVPLYQLVAASVAHRWNTNGNCCIVVGATAPSELAEVRRIVGDLPILIPGVGSQGGDLEEAIRAGANSRGQGMIVNLSRSVLFASSGADYAEAARAELQRVHDQGSAILAAR